jgi:hypothetical protein
MKRYLSVDVVVALMTLAAFLGALWLLVGIT